MNASRIRLFLIPTAVALALRLVHLWLLRDNPLFERPIMDAAIHVDWARGILAGTWPGSEPYFRAPLYPYLLAGLHALFDGARLPIQAVHVLISALGAGLAALSADRLWGRRAGWLAGLLLATLWTSIYFSAELLLVTVPVTLNLLWVWLLIDRPEGPPSGRRLLLAGLALGLSAIARPNVLIVLPAVLWFLWRGVEQRPARRAWALLALGVVLPILPVTVSNLVRSGDAVLIASQGGVNFYIGNNPRSDGRTAIVPDTRPTWQGGYEDAIALAESARGRDLKPSEVDRWFLGRGLAFWGEEPGTAAALYWKKLRMLLGGPERSNNKFIYAWREWSALLKPPVWPGWTVALVLGALGLFVRPAVRGGRTLLVGVVLLYALSILLFFVNARFRLPVAALLCIPAGAGLEALWLAVRNRTWRPGLLGLAVAAGLLAVSMSDWIGFKEHRTELNPFHEFTLGNAWSDAGDPARAETAWRRALEIRATHRTAHFELIRDPLYRNLYGQLMRQGRAREAVDVLEGWLREAPDHMEARLALGNAWFALDEVDAAAAHFELALRTDPQDPGARLGEAWVLLRRGEAGQALRRFQQLARTGGDVQAGFGAGLSLVQLGRDGEAERAFLDVLKRKPDYWQALGNLGEIYARQGRVDEAAGMYRRLLSIRPGDARARAWLESQGR